MIPDWKMFMTNLKRNDFAKLVRQHVGLSEHGIGVQKREALTLLWLNDVIQLEVGPDDMDDQEVNSKHDQFIEVLLSLCRPTCYIVAKTMEVGGWYARWLNSSLFIRDYLQLSHIPMDFQRAHSTTLLIHSSFDLDEHWSGFLQPNTVGAIRKCKLSGVAVPDLKILSEH